MFNFICFIFALNTDPSPVDSPITLVDISRGNQCRIHTKTSTTFLVQWTGYPNGDPCKEEETSKKKTESGGKVEV